jgi:phosphatidylserine/phosphatidylglycerophosphate/cardiolipin synthase-like enzyme
VNFTTNSLDNNREVGVIVDDRRALERFGQTFDRDFQAGRIP